MNLFCLTLLYPSALRAEAARRSRTGLQNQADAFQQSLLRGLRKAGAEVWVANSLPVGVFPLQYKGLRIPAAQTGKQEQELGCVNLPILKQRQRTRRAEKALETWVRQSTENREILVYSLYLPYLRAVSRVKCKHPDLKATLLVTDLPNELGLSSGRKGLAQRLERRWGNESLRLCACFDRYVLLTAQMADVLPVRGKPYTVLEGIAPTEDEACEPSEASEAIRSALAEDLPAVLYTGTLNREFQLDRLLDAFADPSMRSTALWLCGKGDMEAEIASRAEAYPNIRYFGFVSRREALLLQRHAAALINPRANEGLFTRYSFPSKLMEYMLSGKPVLCCKLAGIPDEYDPYLTYIPECSARGIRSAVRALLSQPEAQRAEAGRRCREYVRTQKDERTQAQKLLSMLASAT